MLQNLQDCGCSGLQALILTQRAACRLQRSDLVGALEDCCAALAAEPGSADTLHLKYQAGFLASFLAAQSVICAAALAALPSLVTRNDVVICKLQRCGLAHDAYALAQDSTNSTASIELAKAARFWMLLGYLEEVASRNNVAQLNDALDWQ